ncbi:MAG: TRAP transporter substrate-binding protein [Kiloniellales bacterium]
MQRNLTAVGALAALALLASGALAAEKWDMPVAYPDSNYHTQNAKRFAEAVKAATGGEIEIVVHAGGSLFGGAEIKRAVQTGQAQIGERLISALGNEDPLFEIDAIPFLASDFESARKLWKASKPALDKLLDSQNLVLLYAVPWPPQGLYTKKPIEGAADMKGVKFRAYNAATSRLADLMGAVPTVVEAAELTQAFATGVAESMISSGSTGYDSKLWEHTSHWYDVQAWLPKNMVMINKDTWSNLDPQTQGVILGAAAMAEQAGWAEAIRLSDWYKEQLAAKGMTVEPPGDKLKADFQAMGDIMTKEWLAKAGSEGQAVIEAYQKM